MTMSALPGGTLRRRLLVGLRMSLIAVLLAWAISFAWFLHLVEQPMAPPTHADGIVAFTGGPERVETALRLLSSDRADKLLLSGIGGGAELPELAHRAGVDPMLLAARVTIGRTATTTRGNAMETAAWARSNSIHSLLVVTASYHMPRAMIELERALPDAALYPLPVVLPDRPGHVGLPFRLIAEEYVKYVATCIRLTSVLPSREPAPVHGVHAG
jgi:uncharacterized SAM-binding protein YcdF (DUF218 family)